MVYFNEDLAVKNLLLSKRERSLSLQLAFSQEEADGEWQENQIMSL